MASIIREVEIDAHPDDVWAAVREFHAADRVAPGFVVDCRPDGNDARVVTFFNGAVAREVLVGVDDDARRLVYSVVEAPLPITHDNSSVQVFTADGNRTRLLWIKDVLPDELADRLSELIDRGITDIKQAMESHQAAANLTS
jgi:hypothetical protein